MITFEAKGGAMTCNSEFQTWDEILVVLAHISQYKIFQFVKHDLHEIF